MTTKVSGVMLEDGAVTDASTGFTAGNYPRVAVDGSFEQRTPAQVASDVAAGGGGTVTSVNLTSTTGLTASGGPITGSGSLTYTLSANLQAWDGLAPSAKQNADATLTALAGANWAANSLAIGSGADTVAQVTFAANTFPGRSSTGNLVAKTITDAAFSILDDATVGAILTTIGGQPLDATLTALAGANWAANSLAIGSGSDTVAQVTFAANTFPARTSTGNLVAKSITDSAAAMLTQVVEGTYTPTLVNVANIASSTMRLATWHRVGNTVTVALEWECACTAAAATVTRGRITLPVASALANSFELTGCGTSLDTTFTPIAIFGDVANDQAEMRFLANSTANRVNTCIFSYRVI